MGILQIIEDYKEKKEVETILKSNFRVIKEGDFYYPQKRFFFFWWKFLNDACLDHGVDSGIILGQRTENKAKIIIEEFYQK